MGICSSQDDTSRIGRTGGTGRLLGMCIEVTRYLRLRNGYLEYAVILSGARNPRFLQFGP
jgi:hypothetical protein